MVVDLLKSFFVAVRGMGEALLIEKEFSGSCGSQRSCRHCSSTSCPFHSGPRCFFFALSLAFYRWSFLTRAWRKFAIASDEITTN